MKKTVRLLSITIMLMIILGSVVNAQIPSASTEEKVDFVVVGAGAGGISAAIEAARQGKSVILLEKLAYAGGSSRLCEGYFWSTESKLNKITGEGYDVEKMKAYLKESSRNNANPAYIDAICDISTEIMDFFLDEGVKFYEDQFTRSAGDAQDLKIFVAEGAGAGMFSSMLEIAAKYGVEPRYNSKAIALIVENGEVKGVSVESDNGNYDIYADNTILATGGFLRNEKLMKEYMPEWYFEKPYCGDGSTGEGAEMALDLGAYMVGYGCGGVWSYDGKNGYHMEGGLTPAVSFFIVNQEGKRFCNEYKGSDKNQNILEQTGRVCYTFMDSTSQYTAIAEQGVANGIVMKSDSLEDLCNYYKIDVENFNKTLEEYEAVKAGDGEDPFFVPKEYMISLSQPPYYASIFNPSLMTNCLMGLACDEYCRILNEQNNEPIKNLYGVGELVIGTLCGGTKAGPRYPACGSCLATGIYGGPIAVRHALGIDP